MYRIVSKRAELLRESGKCPSCDAGHKPTKKPVPINYFLQIRYAEIERYIMAYAVKLFNDSGLKSSISTLQDELILKTADGEEDQVKKLLKELGLDFMTQIYERNNKR